MPLLGISARSTSDNMRAVLHVCRSFILARSPLSCSDSLRVLSSLQSPTTRFLLLCRKSCRRVQSLHV
jgi:hypothetical protein